MTFEHLVIKNAGVAGMHLEGVSMAGNHLRISGCPTSIEAKDSHLAFNDVEID